MSRSWAGGSTRRWRRVRAAVLARDGYRCRAHTDGWCDGAPPHQCIRIASHAHHTAGRSVTGDDPRYIVASCPACNLAIGDPAKRNDPPPRMRRQW